MKKYYYLDNRKTELTTKLIKSYTDNNKYYAILEDTIYYPQGGGQKGDRGYLLIENEQYQIINTIKDEEYNSILILDKEIKEEYLDKEVKCFLDYEYRLKQMKLHSVLHLHHVVIEEVIKKELNHPLMSNIEDGYAFNKYNEEDFDITILEEVNKRFQELLTSSEELLTFEDENNKNFRWWKYKDRLIPCGGLHVGRINEIGNIDIEVTNKKKAITIKFYLK